MTKEKESEIEKQRKLNKLALDSKGNTRGYRFQEDSIASQMAYVFGGEDGEKEAARIAREANERYPNILQMKERKEFIENEVKKRSTTLDTNFHKGIKDVFSTLVNKTDPAKGEEAGKEAMLNIMQALGLNVDKDNVQTHYDPGPPQVFQVSWVNRPTKNLADKDSNINKLADCYSNNCDAMQKKEFDNSWKKNTLNAENGGPKMDKQQFMDEADKSFKETVAQAKRGNPLSSLQDETPGPTSSDTPTPKLQ